MKGVLGNLALAQSAARKRGLFITSTGAKQFFKGL